MLLRNIRLVIYQHPLAYLLGLEGIALLRAFAGQYDREFTHARLAEIRTLLDAADQLGEGGWASLMTTLDGYRGWADTYDQAANQMIDLEQPIVWEILDRIPAAVALDAACGTGRHTVRLAELGHTVIGVDNSAEMLAKARAKIPDGQFYEAELSNLPVPDDHVDVLVCALALTHLPRLEPVLSEFVRVLRPGGHLVISDSRGWWATSAYLWSSQNPMGRSATCHGTTGAPATTSGPQSHLGSSSDAARNLAVRSHLSTRPAPRRPRQRPSRRMRERQCPDIWALHAWAPEATNAAYRDSPAAIVLHFQLADG